MSPGCLAEQQAAGGPRCAQRAERVCVEVPAGLRSGGAGTGGSRRLPGLEAVASSSAGGGGSPPSTPCRLFTNEVGSQRVTSKSLYREPLYSREDMRGGPGSWHRSAVAGRPLNAARTGHPPALCPVLQLPFLPSEGTGGMYRSTGHAWGRGRPGHLPHALMPRRGGCGCPELDVGARQPSSHWETP